MSQVTTCDPIPAPSSRALGLNAIASAADAAFVPFAPHNASGPIATAATLQVAAVAPALFLQEKFAPLDAPWRDTVARPAIEVVDGRVAIPDAPGLGIELDEDEVTRHPFVPRDLNLLDDDSILDRSVLPEDAGAIDLVE